MSLENKKNYNLCVSEGTTTEVYVRLNLEKIYYQKLNPWVWGIGVPTT